MNQAEKERLEFFRTKGTLSRDEAVEYHRLLCIEEGHTKVEEKKEAVKEMEPVQEVIKEVKRRIRKIKNG